MKHDKFEKAIRSLSHDQLVHLVDALIGQERVLPLVKENKTMQDKLGINCWDCKPIYRVLGLE